MQGEQQQQQPRQVFSPVWQTLAYLSWAKELAIAEAAGERGAKVCEFFCGDGLDFGKWMKVGSSLYQGIDESAERMQGAKALSVDPKLASKMFCQFEVFDVLHSSIKEVLPPSTFNVVACFREMHRVMESPDVARCFLSNVAYLLKPQGVFVALVHDGSAVWSVLQKEVPDGALPAGFRPQAKKQLFSLSLDEPTRPGHFYGVKYNLNVKKEEAVSNCASVKGGFLINSHQFILAAERCGLRMLSMTNASELLDNYRHLYPESLAKRINGNALHAEQKELVDLHALFVFMRE